MGPQNTVYFPCLNDLIARVRTFIDEAVQANYTNTEIKYALNDAQQTIASEITQVNEHYFTNPIPTIITPIVNPITPLYAFASDFFKLVRVEIQTTGEQVPMIDVNEKSIDNIAIPPLVNSAGYGAGMQAYILGNCIGFTPPPTDPTMIFQYWYDPIVPDMVAGTDIPSIPRMFVDLLPQMACVDMFIKDEDDAATIQMKINSRIEQLKRTARQRQTQNPKYVRRSGYDAPLYPWLGM